MNWSKYKAVFFDVGGTLIKVHPSVGEVYATHARRFGFDGSAEVVEDRFRSQWKESGGMESLGTQSGEGVEKKFWRDLVFNVFEPLGGLKDFDGFFEHIYEVFKKKESWRVYEDVEASGLLGKLKDRGMVLGVVSNWDSRLSLILQNLDLAHYFDFILASTVVGSAKPDGGIFSEALRQSGVRAFEACHIGDEVHTDILGARNAGLDAILVDRNGRHGTEVSPKIRSFQELVPAESA